MNKSLIAPRTTADRTTARAARTTADRATAHAARAAAAARCATPVPTRAAPGSAVRGSARSDDAQRHDDGQGSDERTHGPSPS